MSDLKTAVVTGGSKRVGRAVVERLATAGFKVLFTFNHGRAAAEELVSSLKQKRIDTVNAIELDLATPDAADRLGNIVRLALGDRVDVLVNNASLFLPDDTATGPTAQLQRKLFEVNAFAPALIMSELTPALTVANGCVINFLDLLAEKPWPKYSAYCASKAALKATTLAFARRLAPKVRVNGIAPGVIDWPADMPDADRTAYVKHVPLARAGTPTDAAEVVHWLATGAPYITGEVIKLDGGRSLT
ncbi:MAG: pteridine reductase [Phycisphaerales bacterium]|nr:pteridine reductase [Phycisphaerales bacterium]